MTSGEQKKVFLFHKEDIRSMKKLSAVVVAYNRGHAVKLLAKELEARGYTLEKNDPVTELDLTPDKGSVNFLSI